MLEKVLKVIFQPPPPKDPPGIRRYFRRLKMFLCDFFILTSFSILFFTFKRLFLYSDFKRVMALLEGGLYAILCYIVVLIALRVYQSLAAFFWMSWLMTGLWFYNAVHGAASIGLSAGVGGHRTFESGHITAYGVFFTLFDPLLLMAIVATVIYFRQKILECKKWK